MWKHLGGDPGLTGFLTRIPSRLEQMGVGRESVRQLVGGNIAHRLAGLA